MTDLFQDKTFKVLLVGDAVRFVDNTFTGSTASTVGIDFKMKKIVVNEETISLEIWDTDDVTKEDSFYSLETWLQSINENAPEDVVKCVLGNKNDLMEKKTVTKGIAEKFASKHGPMSFFETSAKTNQNVAESFREMVESIYKIDYKRKKKEMEEGGGANGDKIEISGDPTVPVDGKKGCCGKK